LSYEDEEEPLAPVQEVPRPCDRCGAGNIEYLQGNKLQTPLCAEVQMAFGLIAWLCHDCRKQWHKFFKNLEMHREYTLMQVRIEFWRARIGPQTPEEELQQGLDLVSSLEDLELKINEIANEWLIVEH